MRRADLLIGIGLLFFATLYLRESFEITTGFASDRLGPTFFPRLLAGALAVCALALMWRSLRGRSDTAPLPPVRIGLFVGTVGFTLAYALFLRPLGYLIATPLYLASVVMLLGYRSPVGVTATVVGVTGVLYLVFARALHVLIPMGPLGR